MPSALASRYDLQRNPPYQINYRSKRAGKHITATKRRITFQFGFSSADKIAAGATEANCRGEEHEVVLIWSHVSGKRELYMDGKIVHTSKAARGNTKFQFTWNIGIHVLKIIANGTPPMGENSGMRQFNLFLDGISFFRFFKIYQLGRSHVKGLSTQSQSDFSRDVSSREYSYRGAGYVETEDANEYEEEEVVSNVPPSVEVETKLLDLFETPSIMTAPTLSLTESASSFDDFSPLSSASSNKPTFDSSMIMAAYNNTTNSAPLPLPLDESRSDVNSRALVPVDEDQVDVITKSMKNIVNLDDINSKPFQPISQSSNSNNTKNSSSWGLIGREPTLAEQQQMKKQQNQTYGQAPPPLQNKPYGYANGNAQAQFTYARAY